MGSTLKQAAQNLASSNDITVSLASLRKIECGPGLTAVTLSMLGEMKSIQ